jgi:hypothetical protein
MSSSPLVPIYCFGETDIFDQVANPEGSLVRTIQVKIMNKLSFAPALFTGKLLFFFTNSINFMGEWDFNPSIAISKISHPLITGRGIFQYSFGVLPRRHPIHVVGKFLTIHLAISPILSNVSIFKIQFALLTHICINYS